MRPISNFALFQLLLRYCGILFIFLTLLQVYTHGSLASLEHVAVMEQIRLPRFLRLKCLIMGFSVLFS